MQGQLTQDAWFAIQVKPKHEKATARAIREKGYEELVPTYLCRHKWSDRNKDIELPLFPGYVFCRFDAHIRAPLVTTPGVYRVIGQVEDHEITALQLLVNSEQKCDPWPYIDAGARIRVKAGPLAGIEGTMLASKDKHRLIISVTLLRRSVAIEVNPRWVTPAPIT